MKSVSIVASYDQKMSNLVSRLKPPGNGAAQIALLGMGYLLATHCCPDKLALNGPKSLTHDVRF